MIAQTLSIHPLALYSEQSDGVAGGFQIAPNTMQVRVRVRVRAKTGIFKVKMRKSRKLAGPNPIKLHRCRCKINIRVFVELFSFNTRNHILVFI